VLAGGWQDGINPTKMTENHGINNKLSLIATSKSVQSLLILSYKSDPDLFRTP
jgi:hypothetical protein